MQLLLLLAGRFEARSPAVATADAMDLLAVQRRIQNLRRRLPQLPHRRDNLRCLALTRTRESAAAPRALLDQPRLLRKAHDVAVICHQFFRPRVPKPPVKRVHQVERRMTANQLEDPFSVRSRPICQPDSPLLTSKTMLTGYQGNVNMVTLYGDSTVTIRAEDKRIGILPDSPVPLLLRHLHPLGHHVPRHPHRRRRTAPALRRRSPLLHRRRSALRLHARQRRSQADATAVAKPHHHGAPHVRCRIRPALLGGEVRALRRRLRPGRHPAHPHPDSRDAHPPPAAHAPHAGRRHHPRLRRCCRAPRSPAANSISPSSRVSPSSPAPQPGHSAPCSPAP